MSDPTPAGDGGSGPASPALRDRYDATPGPSLTGLLHGWSRVSAATGEALRRRRGLWSLYGHLLCDAAGVELLRLKPAFLRLARPETTVTVRPACAARPDLPELLLLTWLLRVHADRFGRRVFRRRGERSGDSGRLEAPSDGPERVDAP